MEELVFMKKDRTLTTSLKVAEVFGKAHRKVCRDIENLDCSAEFNTANFGRISYKDSRGRTQRAYTMTKDGFTFLVMGYRGEKAAQFKEAYIKAFNTMEQMLRSRQSPDWVEAREQGKIARKGATDVYKSFVNYAEAQGSTRAQFYYTNLTKLAHKAAGLTTKRDGANTRQLIRLAFMEQLIAETLEEEMDSLEEYHKAYDDVKTVLENVTRARIRRRA